MRTNLDHKVFRKKEEARRLDIQVRWFLRKQKMVQPEQIPPGQSGYLKHCEENKITPYQSTFSEQMTASVQESFDSKGKKLGSKPRKAKTVLRERIEDIKNEDERLLYNRQTRKQAWQEGKKTFIGLCPVHGEHIFAIRMEGSNHRCSKCILESREKQKELLKQEAV
ncbi:hypothetical protein [Acinetobacter schindleri]|uniref:hypothetical protein n=1 Tax=Acinetobacter schindleri TaxID=108981 RepID=UPI0013B08499|nr:hypothetical protein [Acinetobacter schindleri]QIC63287.1 hypothetical protein FSC11_02460 [Acinetobacter schindleri]